MEKRLERVKVENPWVEAKNFNRKRKSCVHKHGKQGIRSPLPMAGSVQPSPGEQADDTGFKNCFRLRGIFESLIAQWLIPVPVASYPTSFPYPPIRPVCVSAETANCPYN